MTDKGKKIIDGVELMRIFKARISESSCSQVAKEFGFSQSYIHQVWTGKRGMSDKLALKLGFKAVSGYLKLGKKA